MKISTLLRAFSELNGSKSLLRYSQNRGSLRPDEREATMLRSGLILLTSSSVGVILQSVDVVILQGPLFKMICSLSLFTSVICFLGTYCISEFAHNTSNFPK